MKATAERAQKSMRVHPIRVIRMPNVGQPDRVFTIVLVRRDIRHRMIVVFGLMHVCPILVTIMLFVRVQDLVNMLVLATLVMLPMDLNVLKSMVV
jgi:hypothetical protein